MFLDIAPSEFLLTATVAVLVIGPKDMPRALRAAGRWMGKMRKVSNHFRAGIETMIREAELEDMEKKWREQNEAIMASVTPGEAPAGSHLLAHEAPAIDPALAPHAPSEAHTPSEPVPPAFPTAVTASPTAPPSRVVASTAASAPSGRSGVVAASASTASEALAASAGRTTKSGVPHAARWSESSAGIATHGGRRREDTRADYHPRSFRNPA